MRNFLQKIFSIKNQKAHKILTIFGIKFKFKSRILEQRLQLQETRQKYSKKFEKYDNKFNSVNKIFAEVKTLLKNLECTSDYKIENKNNDHSAYNNIIPIVLASDENGAAYMYVTIESTAANSNKNTFYDFYLLVPKNFPNNLENIFYTLSCKYPNINISFINMGNEFSDLKLNIEHTASPTYYRLKIADLLPQYKKVIYLDTDVIVKKDLTEYFNIDLEDNFVAGVIATAFLLSPTFPKYYKSISSKTMSNYINAGVIILNIEKIRNENMTEKLCEMSKNNYRTQDQDVINIAFHDKIKVLPFKYNYMTKYAKNIIDNDPALIKIYSEDNMKEANENPVIIHYADKIKPWKDETSFKAQDWWLYAKNTPFYNYFIMDLFEYKWQNHK